MLLGKGCTGLYQPSMCAHRHCDSGHVLCRGCAFGCWPQLLLTGACGVAAALAGGCSGAGGAPRLACRQHTGKGGMQAVGRGSTHGVLLPPLSAARHALGVLPPIRTPSVCRIWTLSSIAAPMTLAPHVRGQLACHSSPQAQPGAACCACTTAHVYAQRQGQKRHWRPAPPSAPATHSRHGCC